LIGVCWEAYKDMVLESKVQAIQLVLREKVTTEDDISTYIGKLSIQVALAREAEITNQSIERPTKVAQALNYILSKV